MKHTALILVASGAMWSATAQTPGTAAPAPADTGIRVFDLACYETVAREEHAAASPNLRRYQGACKVGYYGTADRCDKHNFQNWKAQLLPYAQVDVNHKCQVSLLNGAVQSLLFSQLKEAVVRACKVSAKAASSSDADCDAPGVKDPSAKP